jgi:hypothetical protein
MAKPDLAFLSEAKLIQISHTRITFVRHTSHLQITISKSLLKKKSPSVQISESLAVSNVFIGDESDVMEKSAFDVLIEQCQVLAVKLETTKDLITKHRLLHNSIIPVLQNKQDCIRRKLAQWLDHRLKGKGLTVRHERMMRRLICSIAMRLAVSGDQAMRALHDAHSAISLAEIERAEASEAQAYLKEAMGEAFGRDQVFETLDDVLHAKFDFLRKEAEARSKNSAARRAKKTKAIASQQNADDIEGALRNLYRKLASALHPDREGNEKLRANKNQLMSDVNTAYKRRDLLAMIELHAKAQLPTAMITSTLERQKLGALTELMRDRMTSLHREIRDLELEATAEFVLPATMVIHESSLRHHLNLRKREMMNDLRRLNEDLASIKTDAGLKRWLKEQTVD